MTEEKPKLLIIDDTPDNIKTLVGVLKQDFKITVTTNGVDALELVQDGNIPDLILLDIMMPDMDGFETCKILKTSASTRDVPIIFLTAITEKIDILKAFELGAVDYVTKPFHAAELTARIRNHLELKFYKDQSETSREEITELKKQLTRASSFDHLSGLLTRPRLVEIMEEHYTACKKDGIPFSHMLCRITNLREINLQAGFTGGDHTIEVVGEKIRAILRRYDSAGRWTGSGFLVLLPEYSVEQARQVAGNLTKKMKASLLEFDGQAVMPSLAVAILEVQKMSQASTDLERLEALSKKLNGGEIETL